jgi:hypothetical protein
MLCCDVPEGPDAETVKGVVPNGVPPIIVLTVEVFAPPPPHATRNPVAISSNVRLVKTLPRDFRRKIPGTRRMITARVPPRVSQFDFDSARAERLGAIVVTVSFVAIGLPFGVTEAGEKEQVALAGSPEHANDTAWLKPPFGVMVSEKFADCPCLTTAEVADG